MPVIRANRYFHDLDKETCTAQGDGGGPCLSICADKNTIDRPNLQKITNLYRGLRRKTANISHLQIYWFTSEMLLFYSAKNGKIPFSDQRNLHVLQNECDQCTLHVPSI